MPSSSLILQLIKGNIKTIESNDFLVKVDRVLNGMLPGEYKALNHGIAYVSTEYPDYYWLPCFVVRSGATGAEITFKIVEYEKKGQLYTDMQNLKIDVTYTGLLSIGIRPPQGGSLPIVPTPQPSIAPTISRSISPSIAPALFSTSLVRIAQVCYLKLTTESPLSLLRCGAQTIRSLVRVDVM